MAAEWPRKLLGDLAANFDAKRVPLASREREKRRGPYPYYGATGVMDYVDGFLFEGLHLLIAEDGSVEKPDGRPFVQLVDGKFWVNNHAHVLRGTTDADTKFLYYALSTIPIRPYMTGSVQAKLSQQNLNRIPIPYPPEQTRRGITHILGALDDKIELNRRMNETLEAMARALFKSWFVDFDPVRAKAEGRQPYGMDVETAALFPNSFQDSPVGKIPKGWKIRSLDDIAQFLNGLALQKYPPEGEESLPVIKIAQLRKGNTEGADSASTNIPHEYVVHDGDVLFSWSGSLEVEIWCGGPGALNQHLFKVMSRDYPKWFYFHWIREHLPDFQAIASGKATTMGHIQRHHLKEATVLVPENGLLGAMDKALSPLMGAVENNKLQSRTLVAIRDTLLPKLISGEIRMESFKEFQGHTTTGDS